MNGIAPGGVDTPIIHNFGPPADADMKLIERLMTPIGFAYPHEIAGAFAYLGSHEADYVTGAILSIDGAITELSRGQYAHDLGVGGLPRCTRCNAVARFAYGCRCPSVRVRLEPWRSVPVPPGLRLRRELASPAGCSVDLDLPAGIAAKPRPMPARPLHTAVGSLRCSASGVVHRADRRRPRHQLRRPSDGDGRQRLPRSTTSHRCTIPSCAIKQPSRTRG